MNKNDYISFQTYGELFLLPFSASIKHHVNYCESIGGVIGVPMSEEENGKIINVSLPWVQTCTRDSANYFAWLGIKDDVTEGKWLTFDGSYNAYFKWARNEPNGEIYENCAVIATSNIRRGAWYDVRCKILKLCSLCRIIRTPVLKLKGGLLNYADIDVNYVPILPLEKEYVEFKGFYGTSISYSSESNSYILGWRNKTFATLESRSPLINPIGRNIWRDVSNEKSFELLISKCNKNQFSCASGKCIPLSERCDNFPSCPDRSDEDNCSILNIPEAYKPTNVPPPLPLTFSEKLYISALEISRENTSPLILYVYLNIIRIASVNVMQMEITLEFILIVRWKDSRLEFNNLKQNEQSNLIKPSQFKSIWIPQVR